MDNKMRELGMVLTSEKTIEETMSHIQQAYIPVNQKRKVNLEPHKPTEFSKNRHKGGFMRRGICDWTKWSMPISGEEGQLYQFRGCVICQEIESRQV